MSNSVREVVSKSIGNVEIGFKILSVDSDRNCKVTIFIDDRRKTVVGKVSRLMYWELNNDTNTLLLDTKYSTSITSDSYLDNPVAVLVYGIDDVKNYYFHLVKERNPKKLVDVCPISGNEIVTYVNRYHNKKNYKRLRNICK